MTRLRFALAAIALSGFATVASAATFTVTNTNDSGPGSFRAAIADAWVSPGNTIAFSIGSGPQTIRPLTELPYIPAGTTVDATTQPGFSGKPLIELNGDLLPESSHGISMLGGTLRGFVVNNFPGFQVNAPYREHLVTIVGNYLGTDSSGTAAKRPGFGGLRIMIGRVGGTTPADRNVISGNHTGIHLERAGGGLVVQGNYIGTDFTGTHPIPNLNLGIFIAYSSALTIGGELPAEANVISGNNGYGIELFYSDYIKVVGNILGSTADGGVLAGSQQRAGVVIYQSSFNTIARNVISNHGFAAVGVQPTSNRNWISQNSMTNNNFGIDLEFDLNDHDRVAPNDPFDSDAGPNLLQNYPVITSVRPSGGQTIVRGRLDSEPNSAYSVELFSNSQCNDSGHGEGEVYLGLVNFPTDANGSHVFEYVINGVLPAGHVITATATDVYTNTSEFSPCAFVEGPGELNMAGDVEVSESDGVATVNVVRSGGTVGAITVGYSTSAYAAEPSSDFIAVAGTLTYADGETVKSISIPLIDDAIYERDESFMVALTNPTGGARVGAQPLATVLIHDGGDVAPIVSISDAEAVEDGGMISFALSLDRASGADTYVSLSTSPGTASANVDYQSIQYVVNVPAGTASKIVSVAVFGDGTLESSETFSITIVEADGATIGRGTATGTILDDDAAITVSVDDVRVMEGHDGQREAVFTIKASKPASFGLDYATADGTALQGDYVLTRGFLHFQNVAERTVVVPIIGDRLFEGNEEFKLRLSVFGDPQLLRSTATATIVDDEFSISPRTVSVGVGESTIVTVHLGHAALSPIVVQVTSDDSAVAEIAAQFEIPVGSRNAEVIVHGLRAGTTRVDVTLPDPFASTENFLVTVVDASTPVVKVSPASLSVEIGRSAEAQISLQPPAAGPVTLSVRSTNDRVQVASSVTIPAGGATPLRFTGIRTGASALILTLPQELGAIETRVTVDVSAVPTIPTAIEKVEPIRGSTSGGNIVSISGTFAEPCSVRFGVLSAPVMSATKHALTVIAPPNVAGAVAVTVDCAGGSATRTTAYTYENSSQRIESVTPGFGSTKGGTAVRISATGLDYSCWPFFGDVAASGAYVTSDSVIALTPPHQEGTVELSLRCLNTISPLTAGFLFVGADDPAPAINEVRPSTAAPGDIVEITGQRFGKTQTVYFGDVAARVVSWSGDSLHVQVPTLQPGLVSVTVLRRDAQRSSTPPIFRVTAAANVAITGVTPSRTTAGGDVQLTGQGLPGERLVTIGGQVARLIWTGADSIIVRVPVLPAGTHELVLANRDGNRLAATSLEVVEGEDSLAISSVSPACPVLTGGTAITVKGRGFKDGTRVKVGENDAIDVSIVDGNTLTFVAPAHVAGPVLLHITRSDGAHVLRAGALNYQSALDPGSCVRARPVRR